MNQFRKSSLVFAVFFGAIGCQQGDPPAGAPLALGLQWVTTGGTPDDPTTWVKNEVLDHPADYTHRITSDHYEGQTFIQVRRTYDITDASDAAHEQRLWLQTSQDRESFSTWESLRMAQASISGHPPDSYSVSLRFAAEVSSDPEPGNGILEIDPSRADTLIVTWEYPAEEDALTADFPLEKVD
jgi:hypothetical protein